MKIVIVSDIHDNQVNLEKCLKWCKDNSIKTMICCGDVANGDTLKMLSRRFKGDIYLVKGNAELYDEKELDVCKNVTYYGKIGYFKLSKLRIGFCHEPYLIDKVLEKGECDIIFNGHTHRPWEHQEKGVGVINPGTLGGMFQKGTFAVMNTEGLKMELKVLELIK